MTTLGPSGINKKSKLLVAPLQNTEKRRGGIWTTHKGLGGKGALKEREGRERVGGRAGKKEQKFVG